jgi:hypothetical protein
MEPFVLCRVQVLAPNSGYTSPCTQLMVLFESADRYDLTKHRQQAELHLQRLRRRQQELGDAPLTIQELLLTEPSPALHFLSITPDEWPLLPKGDDFRPRTAVTAQFVGLRLVSAPAANIDLRQMLVRGKIFPRFLLRIDTRAPNDIDLSSLFVNTPPHTTGFFHQPNATSFIPTSRVPHSLSPTRPMIGTNNVTYSPQLENDVEYPWFDQHAEDDEDDVGSDYSDDEGPMDEDDEEDPEEEEEEEEDNGGGGDGVGNNTRQ